MKDFRDTFLISMKQKSFNYFAVGSEEVRNDLLLFSVKQHDHKLCEVAG
jgi:hypothetical protein